MSNHKVTLEVTTEQAAAIVRQLDLAMRIHLCQFREIEHLARMDVLKHRSGRCLSPDECNIVDDLLVSVSRVFGFDFNSSFGIGSESISKDAHRAYEIYKVLQKALAEHRDPNPQGMRGVNYDGLICRYTSDPAPVATVTEDMEAA